MFYRCFFLFFLFLFRPPKIWDNRSRERLNGFSWNVYQMIGGECNLKRRAAAWRGAKFGHFVNFSYTYFRAKKVPQSWLSSYAYAAESYHPVWERVLIFLLSRDPWRRRISLERMPSALWRPLLNAIELDYNNNCSDLLKYWRGAWSAERRAYRGPQVTSFIQNFSLHSHPPHLYFHSTPLSRRLYRACQSINQSIFISGTGPIEQ